MKYSGYLCLVMFCFFVPFAFSQTSGGVSYQSYKSSHLLENAGYQTLLDAVKATEMMDMLKGKGAFTVFAPSDEAFKRLNPLQIRELLRPENKKILKSLISYHIVAGELTASRILKAMCRGGGTARLVTIQGEELLASMEGTDIVLRDCSGNEARIINADANQENLIFHQIDSVVLPQALNLP